MCLAWHANGVETSYRKVATHTDRMHSVTRARVSPSDRVVRSVVGDPVRLVRPLDGTRFARGDGRGRPRQPGKLAARGHRGSSGTDPWRGQRGAGRHEAQGESGQPVSPSAQG